MRTSRATRLPRLSAKLPEALQRFAQTLGVPAVGGALIDANGSSSFEVEGHCKRGEDIAASLDQQWHIGSCTKSITAALFARLVEDGRTDWQASLGTLLPDLRGDIHPAWHDRPIDELFYCRAGMQANPSIKSMLASWSDTRTLQDQRSDVAVRYMQAPPKRVGTFVYSNLSYIVIGAAIDRLVGSSYEQALREWLLEPLGITSLNSGPPPDIWGHSSRLRLGSLLLGKGSAKDPAEVRSDNPAVFSSAGTLHLTLPDWGKFMQLFVTEGGGLLKPETVRHLVTEPPDYRMTKGWGRAELPGVSYGVQGSNTAWAASAMISEDFRRAALVVCNDGRSRVLYKSALLAAEILDA